MPLAAKRKQPEIGPTTPDPQTCPRVPPYVHLLGQHYQSFCAFQHHAMVMTQLLYQRHRLLDFQTPQKLCSSMNPSVSVLSPFQDLQSDQGYSSSLTSGARSKSSRSAGSDTSSDTNESVPVSPDSVRLSPDSFRVSPNSFRVSPVSFRVSPDSLRVSPNSAGSTPACYNINNSLDCMDNTLQGNEVTSTVGHSRMIEMPVFEDSARSRLPPLSCEAHVYQGNGYIPIEAKMDEASLLASTATTHNRAKRRQTTNGDTDCEIDLNAETAKHDIDSPEKLMNSDVDVMWAVKPELSSESRATLLTSPEKWSHEDSSDSSQFLMLNGNSYNQLQYPYSLQGVIPSVKSFNQSGTRMTPVTDGSQTASDSTQIEAMDLSLPSKRKACAPRTENKRRRQRKSCQPLRALGENEGIHTLELTLTEKAVIKVELPSGLKRVLQTSSDQNRQHTVPVVDAKSGKNSIQKTLSNGSDRASGNGMSQKEKRFTCDVCDKRYSQRSSLHTHMRIHTGVRPYVCKDCGRSFTDCSTYIKHCRLHTGEKPYACGACGRRFTQSGNMMRHQQKCKGGTL